MRPSLRHPLASARLLLLPPCLPLAASCAACARAFLASPSWAQSSPSWPRFDALLGNTSSCAFLAFLALLGASWPSWRHSSCAGVFLRPAFSSACRRWLGRPAGLTRRSTVGAVAGFSATGLAAGCARSRPGLGRALLLGRVRRALAAAGAAECTAIKTRRADRSAARCARRPGRPSDHSTTRAPASRATAGRRIGARDLDVGQPSGDGGPVHELVHPAALHTVADRRSDRCPSRPCPCAGWPASRTVSR